MGILRGTLVLGMELGAYKEGMHTLWELHYLGETGLGIMTRCY